MKPEIILKEWFAVNAEGTKEYPYPVIVILANKAGWQYLAQRCRWMATRRGIPRDPHNPDDHSHLSSRDCDANSRLTDEIEFRLGIITTSNRKAVMKRYGITARSRRRGSLIPRFERLIRLAKEEEKAARSVGQPWLRSPPKAAARGSRRQGGTRMRR